MGDRASAPTVWRRSRSQWALLSTTLLLFVFLPGPAQAAKVGGGSVMGTMSFEEPGIAPLGPTCTSPDLEPNAEPAPGFEAFSEAFILDTQVVGYAGPLRIKGTGQLGCQTASSGAGALQLEAHGDNQLNGSSIDCPDLDGNFIRVGTHMSVHLAGPCTINEEETTPIQFLGEFEFVPTDADQGAGVTQPIMSAEIAGAFSMTPS